MQNDKRLGRKAAPMRIFELTLAALVKEGCIIKTGAGKNTTYIRNTDDVK